VPASGTSVCDALDRALSRCLILRGDGAREFVSSRRRLAANDVLFVANMAEASADVDLVLSLPGDDILICDPDTLERYRPDGNRQVSWHFEPWQAFLVIAGDAAGGDAALPRAPAWLTPARCQSLDGEWEFELKPGNMLRLCTQVRPDPDNAGVAGGWHRDATDDEHWVTPNNGRELPEPLQPQTARWYWMRTTVTCDTDAGRTLLACDSPDFLDVFVNGQAAPQTTHDPLWTEENVWFDLAGLLEPGRNAIHIRARTSKYSDPRIGAFAASAKLLQPVVLVGDFLVGDRQRLMPWAGKIDADRPWENQGLPHFAGSGTYRREIHWDGESDPVLLLPRCTDAVEVLVNGVLCGVRTWPPYVFDLNSAMRQGENILEIRVHNTLGNIITEVYGGKAPAEFPVSGLLTPPRLLTV